jgi:hypothetical protein
MKIELPNYTDFEVEETRVTHLPRFGLVRLHFHYNCEGEDEEISLKIDKSELETLIAKLQQARAAMD